MILRTHLKSRSTALPFSLSRQWFLWKEEGGDGCGVDDRRSLLRKPTANLGGAIGKI